MDTTTVRPQPHEGVIGEDRPDDPVLTMTAGARLILARTAYQLYSATLVGHAAPMVRDLRERMTHPRPGDYVVVTDILSGWRSMQAQDDRFIKGVGVYLLDRDEWWTTDEQWEHDKREDPYLTEADRMVDHPKYVQYLPDARSVCRWVNCDVIAIPESVR